MNVVLVKPDDRKAVRELPKAIDGVKAALDVAVDARAEAQLLTSMRTLGDRTRNVLDRLYVKAELKASLE